MTRHGPVRSPEVLHTSSEENTCSLLPSYRVDLGVFIIHLSTLCLGLETRVTDSEGDLGTPEGVG